MIAEFKGEYRWLSNFHLLENPLKYNDIYYPTVEHFYVAMKTKDQDLREIISKQYKVKTFGKTIELREDWGDIKIAVMKYGTKYKYSNNNPLLRNKLIQTKDIYIQEGNWWNDKFWGVCLKTGEGENKLGEIIMLTRKNILEGKW